MTKFRIIHIVFFSLFIPGLNYAQGSKVIKKNSVESQTVYEYFVSEGNNNPLIEKYEKYDSLGNTIEQKLLNKDGDLKSWIKWEYDDNGDIIKEITFDEKGRILEKVIFVYENKLIIEKQYYDKKDRLYKRKEYKYEYWGEDN